MRKLVLLSALLFTLGVAFLSRPAVAIPSCECGFCSFSSTSFCYDDEHEGFRYRCSEYLSLYC